MDKLRYRNEIKYLISQNEIPIIQSRLDPLMVIDKNAKNGKYLISSLYFDDYFNRSYFDVDDGTDVKDKFRIRLYDHDDSFIRLEKKHKRNNMTMKKSCSVDKEMTDLLIKGGYPRDIAGKSAVLLELTYKIMSSRYKPVIIVDYERIPYVYKEGNVRITLDMNIESSVDIDNFLRYPRYRRPVLPEGVHLLEVKYDEFLPDFIYGLLNDLNLQQISFSKYYLSRKYNVNGGISL